MNILPLFAATGLEWEYMIAHQNTLDVMPVADELIRLATGSYQSNVERGLIDWSNELALHVVELKTAQPVSTLAQLPQALAREINHINSQLETVGAKLMPGAMHPWMDPHRETRLWPHEYNPVYEAFNRIFGCQGHGWSNLQSLHLNLPFATDEEFGRLHAAIRVVLPLLPAIAASSPFQDGQLTKFFDNRLHVYRTNSKKIPSVSGRVIPEPVFSIEEYQTEILAKMYRDIAPYDPEGTLQHEWLNARGAIARFERHAIEIRVLDVQECPQADVAIAAAIIALLRSLVAEDFSTFSQQSKLSTQELEAIFLDTIRSAGDAQITNLSYLNLFGHITPTTAAELWTMLLPRIRKNAPPADDWLKIIELILAKGTLAQRLVRATGSHPTKTELHSVYDELCDCLAAGAMFRPI